MFCTVKFLVTFVCLSLGVFKSRKTARDDELLHAGNYENGFKGELKNLSELEESSTERPLQSLLNTDQIP